MGTVLVHLWMPRIAQKLLRAALEANFEAEAVWRELGILPKLAETYEMRQFLYMLADELDEQFAASSELHRLGRSTDNHWSQGNALFLMSNVHRLQGRFAEALSDIREAMANTKFGEHPLWKQSESYFRNEGKAILDGALALCSPNNVWSHAVIWIAITDAYLQIALGSPERAFSRLEGDVHNYREAGFCFNLAEELWLRGRARLALGEVEAAKEILLEAKAVAKEKEERIFLWQILATLGDLEEMSEDVAEAEKLREQTCEIIQYIADRAGDEEDLRASFLAQPEVVRVLNRSKRPPSIMAL